MPRRRYFFLVLLVTILYTGTARGDAVRIAVFPFEIFDTSGEPYTPETQIRLNRVSDLLRQLLDETGRYKSVDTSRLKDKIADIGNLYGCNGCIGDLLAELPADLGFLGTIRKVSSLILGINITVIDARSNRVIAVHDVGIRGDNDESWHRGVRYIVRNKIAVADTTTDP